jgi:hypothetical protein
MPCYRCGERQTDPGRGASPWKRGVRGDTQVLICPACQSAHDWTRDLDHCPGCGGMRLVRRLGEVECKDCGQVGAPGTAAEPAPAGGATAPGLAEEVARALDRVLSAHRGPR